MRQLVKDQNEPNSLIEGTSAHDEYAKYALKDGAMKAILVNFLNDSGAALEDVHKSQEMLVAMSSALAKFDNELQLFAPMAEFLKQGLIEGGRLIVFEAITKMLLQDEMHYDATQLLRNALRDVDNWGSLQHSESNLHANASNGDILDIMLEDIENALETPFDESDLAIMGQVLGIYLQRLFGVAREAYSLFSDVEKLIYDVIDRLDEAIRKFNYGDKADSDPYIGEKEKEITLNRLRVNKQTWQNRIGLLTPDSSNMREYYELQISSIDRIEELFAAKQSAGIMQDSLLFTRAMLGSAGGAIEDLMNFVDEFREANDGLVSEGKLDSILGGLRFKGDDLQFLLRLEKLASLGEHGFQKKEEA